MSALTVWGAGTSRTMRAYWMLEELGLTYTSEPIGPRTGETQTDAYGALNPKRKVPALVDGNLVIAESGAIINYLADKYGAETGIIPAAGSDLRGRYDDWCFFVAMELDATTLYVMRKHGDLAPIYGEAPAAMAAASAGVERMLPVIEARLGATSGPWALDEQFTGADIWLATTMDWARAYGFTLPAAISEHCHDCHQRPAFQRAKVVNAKASAALPS